MQSGATAVVTMELERGVVGDLANLGDLREAACDRGVPAACGRLVSAARAAGIPVVHCVAQWRPDRVGSPLNTPLTRHLDRFADQILEGTAAVELIPELGDTSGDLRSVRHHGLAPFHGTDLDPLLRSIGVSHLVVAGVSLNVGVTGLVIGAVDRGFEVTVASDAVVGVPAEYGDDVMAHTISALARIVETETIVGSWTAGVM